MVAKVFKTGTTWVSSDDPAFHVYAPKGSVWAEVAIAKVWAVNPATGTYAWMEVFNKYQVPPTNVRGINATVSGGKLMWNAAESATDYQVLERIGTSTVVTRRYPSATEWTPELSYDITALNADTSYNYTVIARRQPSGGQPVYSVESAKATLSTGHNPTPQIGTNQVVTVQASKSDSWSNDQGWGQTAGNVMQGYASSGSRNAHGAISYSTTYSQLATKLNKKATDGTTVPVVDHITLSNAVITRVYRGTAGTGNPRVEGHAWKAVFSGNPRDNDFPSLNGNFTAPDESDAKENFKFLNPDDTSQNMLLYWANQWIKKAPTYTGILIFRTDGGGNATAGYNGYCAFRAANTYSTDWQLTLTVSWNFNYPELKPATWTPGG